MAKPALGMSRKLGEAGFPRHVKGTAGYVVTSAGVGLADVWHCDSKGMPVTGAEQLAGYQHVLINNGYRLVDYGDAWLSFRREM